MENATAIPVVSNCMFEHDPLWIAVMVTVSAISTLVALILRKRPTRARARARPREEEMV